MLRNAETPKLSPGQAQYVVERLVSDGRVSPAEVARYVGDIQREIADVESRLQHLRAVSGLRAPAQRSDMPERTGENGPTRTRAWRGRKRRGNPLAGRYMGYMRQVPKEKKGKYQRLKQEKGYDAAIAQLKADLGK